MRRVLCLAAVLVAWGLLPGSAQARPAFAQPCGCTQAATLKFVSDAKALRRYKQEYTSSMANGVLSLSYIARTRSQIRTRVEDWALYADVNKDNFCRNHRKVCRAAIACISAGFATWSGVKAGGGSDDIADVSFAIACAQAAANTMLGI